MTTRQVLQSSVLILAMILLAGCSGDADRSFQELKQIADESKEGSLEARSEKDPDKARKLADRASGVAEAAEKKLAALETPTEEEQNVVSEIAAAAKSAEATANLAREDADLAKQLKGWKFKSYAGTRKLLLKGVFLGLSYSATKVDEKGIDSLPEKVRKRAELGADLVYQYTGLEKVDGEEHDWKRIAEELKEMAGSPPDEIAAMLAVTYLIGAQKGLALYEIESLDLEEIDDQDRKLTCQVIRSVILSANGYKGLSLEYMRATIEEHQDAADIGNLRGTDNTIEKADDPREMLGMLHLGLAALQISEKRYAEADKEMVNAIKVWPNNPLTVFLTGELLLADGKKEAAIHSLETAAADSEYEWLAKVIAERAKEIRDGKDDSESLVYNARVIGELVTRAMIEEAKDSEKAERLKEWIDTRKSLGDYFDEAKKRVLPKREDKAEPNGDETPSER